MFFRIALSMFTALALSACVLQSPQPNFDDKYGQPLLGKTGGTYHSFTLERDTWKLETDSLIFEAEDQHYIIKNSGKPAQVLFIPISNQWWLAQFKEGKNDTSYVFANVQPDAIYFHPLKCENLKFNGTAAVIVTFKKDNCVLEAGTKLSDVKSLIQGAGQRTLKLVLNN
jgi:hypothetical protein